MITKEKLKKAKNYIVDYFCSDYFTITLSLLTVVFWAMGVEILGTVVFVSLACICLWLSSDLKPVLTVIMFITMIYSLTQIHEKSFLVMVYVLVPIIIASFAYNFIRFRGERQYKKGKLFYGMLTAFIAAVLSGVAYPLYNKIYMLVVFGVGLGIYLVYFICINCTKKNLGIHICKILFFAGLIVCVQLLLWFLRQPDFMHALLDKQMRVGWGMKNTVAVVLVMAVPALCWLGINDKFFSYIMFPVSALFIITLFSTLSRGNILFGMPLIGLALLVGFFKARTIWTARIIGLVTVLVVVTVFALLPITKEVFASLQHSGLNPNGRLPLYKRAIENFRNNPIFGVGFFKPVPGNVGDGPAVTFLWKTHNTPLQILSCMGIFGVIGMIPFYLQRYWTLVNRFTPFKFFAMIAILAFELEGLVDLTFLSVHQLFFVFGLLAAAEIDPLKMQLAGANMLMRYPNGLTFFEKKVSKKALSLGR